MHRHGREADAAHGSRVHASCREYVQGWRLRRTLLRQAGLYGWRRLGEGHLRCRRDSVDLWGCNAVRPWWRCRSDGLGGCAGGRRIGGEEGRCLGSKGLRSVTSLFSLTSDCVRVIIGKLSSGLDVEVACGLCQFGQRDVRVVAMVAADEITYATITTFDEYVDQGPLGVDASTT